MKKKIKIRNAFSDIEPVEHKTGGEQITQQQFAEEANINTIVGHYMKTGQLGNPQSNRQAIFGDFSSIDFHEMRNQIADAEQAFEALPARIRNKFDNEPYQLLRWLENPANQAEAIKLGLANPPEEVKPDPNQQSILDAIHKASMPNGGPLQFNKKAEEPDPTKPDPEANPRGRQTP